MKATFLGIGAQKCATTWLHDILADHPQVSLPSTKEVDFFSNYFDYGFQWYENHFRATPAQRVCGEVSPSYLHGLAVPKRVFAYDKHMRLILLLRNPIDRAVSNHKHEVRIGHLSGADLTFEFGLHNNPAYVEQGLYASHLERWLEYFPRQRILVMLMDDIIADTGAAARTVYEFLGVRSDHLSKSLHERSNESYVNPHQSLERMRKAAFGAMTALGMGRLWTTIAAAGARKIYRQVNWRTFEGVIPPMKEATREKLRAEFAPDLERLEVLIGRSLKHWS